MSRNYVSLFVLLLINAFVFFHFYFISGNVILCLISSFIELYNVVRYKQKAVMNETCYERNIIFELFFITEIISRAWCGTAVSPLLTHWRYRGLALMSSIYRYRFCEDFVETQHNKKLSKIFKKKNHLWWPFDSDVCHLRRVSGHDILQVKNRKKKICLISNALRCYHLMSA